MCDAWSMYTPTSQAVGHFTDKEKEEEEKNKKKKKKRKKKQSVRVSTT